MKVAFFVFIALSTLSLSSCQKTPTPVRDTDGNNLKADNNYYILPVMHDAGGGLITARSRWRGEICPTEVAQEIGEGPVGTPLKFIPASPNKDGIIRESTDLNIMFVDPHACVPNAVWMVDAPDVGEPFVSSQGLLGKPGPQTIKNWFKIQKYQDSYKLVYCPSVCKTCKPACADIGIRLGERGRRSLSLNNKPFKFKFKKA